MKTTTLYTYVCTVYVVVFPEGVLCSLSLILHALKALATSGGVERFRVQGLSSTRQLDPER